AAFAILLLESFIFITGNYNWFNLQTMLLCLALFDDAALRSVLPRRVTELRLKPKAPRPAVRYVANAVAVLIVRCSLVQMTARFGGNPPAWAHAPEGWVDPPHMLSGHGRFSHNLKSAHES